MKCPKCQSEQVIVVGGKHTAQGNYRRNRRCDECKHTFSTIEYYVPDEKVRHKRKAFKEDDYESNII